jgi:hypothetical protein
MLANLKPLRWLLLAGVAVAVSVLLFRFRYMRTAVIDDWSVSRTQTVSVSFLPHTMHWKVSGHVQGTGTVMISSGFSNVVTGSFSIKGGGDYYETNATVVFVPNGQASGKILASFRFGDFP